MASRLCLCSLSVCRRYITSQQLLKASNGHTRLWSRPYSKEKYSKDYFEGLVTGKPLVLFMKGEPTAPMCGFSRLVVQILAMHGLTDYSHHDVLEDVEFKESLKTFSNWPTFPQVYINGELVGGSDIMLQMHQNGELIGELEKIGHRSALLDKDQSNT